MNNLRKIGIKNLKREYQKDYEFFIKEHFNQEISRSFSEADILKLQEFVDGLNTGLPRDYLIGNSEFYDYKFFVDEGVLIPRPETELIIEETLKIIRPESSKRLLDVGTGSGCIIISLINERPKCNGRAIDISKKALKIAKFNAKMHHLQNKINFANMNIDKFNDNKYDFIVSNPPYITKQDLSGLDDDVRFYEPYLALEAGVDGLREIKKLILKSKHLLKINGRLIFEIGKDQMEYSKYLLKINGFYINKVSKDLNLIPRVIVATKII